MKIVILGSGNVANHFALRFDQLGYQIVQVYSRHKANAQALALRFNAIATDDLNTVDPLADLYVIAVSDEAIPEVAAHLSNDINGIVVHTSGATDLSILQAFMHSGVLYPVQSISKNIETDFTQIPIGVEASSTSTMESLWKIAKALSHRAFECNSKQRMALHVSAVIVNNFSNILYQLSYEMMQDNNLSFELLLPIIQETAKKVQNKPPIDGQTGPAIRNDNITINKHLNFLRENPPLQTIYQQLTLEIAKRRDK
ncbi:Rossmann-like and DUF2520 domain-containing protein [Sphingobacterium spiritivorum]|uniref:Rossmann-like and DUF2520 domain-containing protein n=1 Tax=Sphingobacterium spiritivorum TaxID=258 RepID=UPI003DA3C230